MDKKVILVIFIFAISLASAMNMDNSSANIIAHKGGKYWEGKNFSYINDSINNGATIIELDIRWSLFRGYIVKHGVGMPGFDRELWYPYQGKLKDALKVIDNRAMLYLDIKETSISPRRLINYVKKYHNNTIIIGGFSWNYLKKFKELDNNITLNLNSPLPIPFFIRKAKEIGASWVNPFPYGLGEHFAKEIQKENLNFVPAGIEEYPLAKKYLSWGAYAVSIYDIKEFEEYINSSEK